MLNRPDVSVIIVNWNSKALIRHCVSALLANQGTHHYEIIVVDNASFDGCGTMLGEQFPSVRFVQSEHNLGFGRANNLVAAQSNSDLLLFLNPDTEVQGDAIAQLIAAARRLPNCGAVGATLLNSDRSVQASSLLAYPTVTNQLLDSDLLRRWWPRSRLWANAALFAQLEEPTAVEAISGACLLMPRAVFTAIGGFSAEYFMYSEDTDICYKAHLHGCRNYYVPTARVIHFGDGSVTKARSNFAVVMAVESLWRYMAKHHGRGHAWLFRAAVAAASVFRLGVLLIMSALGRLRRSPRSVSNSLTRWNTILRWSLALENWVLKY